MRVLGRIVRFGTDELPKKRKSLKTYERNANFEYKVTSGEEITKTYSKWKKINNLLIILPIIFILAYELKDTRAVIKYFVRWLQEIICKAFMFFGYESELLKKEWTEWIATYHYCMELLCLIVVAIGGLSMLFLHIFIKEAEKATINAKGSNDFEENILLYLNHSDAGRCFLLSGEWGSGKSYALTNFLNKYYSDTSRNIYRISCFGLITRKDVVDELSKVIGNSDNSVMSLCIEIIGIIPVIGELLTGILKKSYGYSSVKKGSIFVFDDFERLVSPSVMHELKSSLDWKSATDGVNKTLLKYLMKTDEEKYLSIIGVINEMIEIYRYKVIIVCNTKMLGEKFVNDILRSKLNCFEYKKEYSNLAAMDLLGNIIQKHISNNNELSMSLYTYISRYSIEDIFMYIGKKDLRSYSNLVEVFIISLKKIMEQHEPSKEMRDSLFMSILLFIRFYNRHKVEKLKEYPIGMNLGLVDDADTQKFIKSLYDKEGKICRWVGFWLAGKWFYNDYEPYMLVLFENYTEWKAYFYQNAELKLINGDFNILEDDYDIPHILYVLNREKKENDNGSTSLGEKLFRNYLHNKDLSSPYAIQLLIDSVERCYIRYNLYAEKMIITCIAEESNYMISAGSSNIDLDYNDCVNKNKSKHSSLA